MNKRMRKKHFCSLLAIAALTAGGMGNTVNAAEDPTFSIGICQFLQHQALDGATRGFQDALTEKLGDRVAFHVENAQGDYANCATIINEFVSENVDLILANATAPLQAAATATTKIPILGTSVTEYSAALQLSDFDGTVGRNISGTSDLAPLEEQAAMVKELFPEADKVGLLYCSGEPNSQYQVDTMREELETLGYTCQSYTFSDSNDISSVTMTASSECDVIYIPTDNMAASNAELIANVCVPDKTPVIAGEENTCRHCGIATFSIDYYDLGYTTGEMAADILLENQDISSMPIQYASDFTKRYNEAICQELGLVMPEDYIALEAEE